MNIKNPILSPDNYYHIYNHGNADDNIFRNNGNYSYFLNRYAYYINPVAETCAYCLLPNHFHFIIHVKNEMDLLKIMNKENVKTEKIRTDGLPDFVNQQSSNFFNAYSKAFNKMYKRKGKRFRLPFKRKHLDTDAYLLKAIHYIYSNPVHHAFVKNMNDWSYSSIHAYESERKTQIQRHSILEMFGSLQAFKKYHAQPVDTQYKIEMDF